MKYRFSLNTPAYATVDDKYPEYCSESCYHLVDVGGNALCTYYDWDLVTDDGGVRRDDRCIEREKETRDDRLDND